MQGDVVDKITKILSDGKKTALIVVDVQNDFCPGGALPVPNGDEVLAPINDLMLLFSMKGLPIIKTRDWHPVKTTHFKEWGGQWPPHCVQGTPGANFRQGLARYVGTVIVSKGMEPDEDSYSGFDGFDEQGRPLAQVLKDAGVERVIATGLATDWCVKNTVLDACKEGFEAVVVTEAMKPVEKEVGDTERAIKAMVAAGITVI